MGEGYRYHMGEGYITVSVTVPASSNRFDTTVQIQPLKGQYGYVVATQGYLSVSVPADQYRYRHSTTAFNLKKKPRYR
jgi:hypothetical protein